MSESLITEVDILDESKDCFLTFAEEVLTDRAVPNAEDGLLSAHRKLLWTMEEVLKMNSKSKFKKSASVVGSTLASSYFHGEAACYGALCKLVQPYLMRYPLVEGDGNLGSQEANGMEAASRYTNVKPSKFADLMMTNFKKGVVPLKETYNGEYMEPVILPSTLPNAIINGREAIAVGLSHSSLPNNLSEVCDGIVAFIKNKNITIDELMEYIKGPDFPLGNVIINSKDIKKAFETGHSEKSLKVRGDYEIKGDKIIFNTIPYRTYRNKIKEQINQNIDKLEEFFSDFDDESNVGINKLVFTVKKGIEPEKAVLKLFALTDLQTTVSYNMNFIINGTPKMCSMLDLIKAYVEHQHKIMIVAAMYDKDKAEKRIHILNGLLIAVDKIDEVIRLIKTSTDKSEAAQRLIEFLSIDDVQAKAILDMKLSSLTKINKKELIDELEEKKRIVLECNEVIENESYRDMKLVEQLESLKSNYGDQRRTKLLNIEVPKEDKEAKEIIPEDSIVIISQTGNIKRIPKSSFKTQKRNGKGVKNQDEALLTSISTNTIDNLLLFTSKGKMYKLSVNNVPVGTNSSKGTNISNFINISPGENIIAVTSLQHELNAKYVIFFTKKGLVKKTSLDEYMKVKRTTGIIAINLKEGDSLSNVTFVNDEEVIVVTKEGMSIKFDSKNIPSTGRATYGVKSIKLAELDEVVAGLPIFGKSDNLAIFTEDGIAKKIDINEITLQERAGKGLVINKIGKIIGATLINDEDNILLIGRPNSICIKATDIPFVSRTSLGNIMIKGKVTLAIKL